MSKILVHISVAELGEEPGRTDPLLWVKKEEITEGKKASKARKSRPGPIPPPPPSLAQGLDLQLYLWAAALKNATATCHFGFVFRATSFSGSLILLPPLGRMLCSRDYREVIVTPKLRFQSVSLHTETKRRRFHSNSF